MVDFAHVPVGKTSDTNAGLHRPVTFGRLRAASEQRHDTRFMHVTAQGVIAGANMVLVDFHPDPQEALVDGPQALRLEELPYFLEDVRIVRNAYEQRRRLFQQD